jgi:LSD1 subclass zinc finger protein
MPIQLECEGCRKPLQVAERLAGRYIRCPHCQSRQQVPGDEEDVAPPRRSATGARPSQAKAGPVSVPWFLYLIGALPLGLVALAMIGGAAAGASGSGSAGQGARLVWVIVGGALSGTTMTVARAKSPPMGFKVALGLVLAAAGYAAFAIVALAAR